MTGIEHCPIPFDGALDLEDGDGNIRTFFFWETTPNTFWTADGTGVIIRVTVIANFMHIEGFKTGNVSTQREWLRLLSQIGKGIEYFIDLKFAQ